MFQKEASRLFDCLYFTRHKNVQSLLTAITWLIEPKYPQVLAGSIGDLHNGDSTLKLPGCEIFNYLFSTKFSSIK